jgi:hypothetical protein
MNLIAKRILLTIAGILGGVVFLLLLIWLFPQTVITTKTVKWMAAKQSAIQFEPQFPQDFDIDVRNSQFFKQKVSIKASDFCMETKDHSFKACFNRLNVETKIDFKKLSLVFDSLGPVIIDASTIEVNEIEKDPKEKKHPKKTKDNSSSFPLISKDFTLENVEIALPQISINSKQANLKAFVKIDGTRPGKDLPYHLVADLKAESDKEPKTMALQLASDIDSDYNLKGTFNAHVGSGGRKPDVTLESSLQGSIKKAEGELMGTIKAMYVTPTIPMIEIQKFKLVKSDKLTAEGDFNVEFLVGSLNDSKKSALPPPKFKTILSGKLQAEQSKNAPIKFNVVIPPVEQYGMITEAKTKGEYDTKKSLLDLETLLFSFKINEFQKTVRGLKNTQMAIPAPINEMNGTISLTIGGENLKKSGEGHFVIPAEFKTELSSKNQSLITQTTGSTDIQTSPFKGNLDLNVELNDIALQLPEFDPISKMPTVVGDKRFVKSKDIKTDKEIYLELDKKEEPKEPSAFTTNIKITTPNKPIRIFYKLFKPAAVFRVTTTSTAENSSFLVKFEPFEVSYLKRTAKLEHLNISNDEKSKTNDLLLDGRFLIKKADYKLYANIHQENKKTYIELTSEPPLSEDDIISLILFNELSSELDSGSTDSVENTQSAMTKKSIGFFSFFVLSSTPVESVNYDSVTGQYSARVKLPGGFTGTVGSDWDKAQEVGIRRRLGGKWVISAGFGTDAEGDSRQESMIEWFHRY